MIACRLQRALSSRVYSDGFRASSGMSIDRLPRARMLNPLTEDLSPVDEYMKHTSLDEYMKYTSLDGGALNFLERESSHVKKNTYIFSP
jgi:hypothetical protein